MFVDVALPSQLFALALAIEKVSCASRANLASALKARSQLQKSVCTRSPANFPRLVPLVLCDADLVGQGVAAQVWGGRVGIVGVSDL